MGTPGSKCRVGAGKKDGGVGVGAESKCLLLDHCSQRGTGVYLFSAEWFREEVWTESTLPLLPLRLFPLQISGLLCPEELRAGGTPAFSANV